MARSVEREEGWRAAKGEEAGEVWGAREATHPHLPVQLGAGEEAEEVLPPRLPAETGRFPEPAGGVVKLGLGRQAAHVAGAVEGGRRPEAPRVV